MQNESMWFAMWAGVAAKSTVVLAVAWLMDWVLRRRSAAVRHLIWTAAAVAVLALPLFSVWVPAVRVPSIGTRAGMPPHRVSRTNPAQRALHSRYRGSLTGVLF